MQHYSTITRNERVPPPHKHTLEYHCYSTLKKNKNSAVYRDICTPMFVCGIIHDR